MSAGWSNAVHAILPSPFVEDVGLAVGNDPDAAHEAGARWLISMASDYLRRNGLPDGPIAAFDFAVWDIEAIGKAWFVVRMALAGNDHEGPALARFCAERMPSIWDGPSWTPHAPVSQAVVIADRVDTLVSLFSVGLKPSGSKDPYALRRAARHFLMQVMFPITRSHARPA